MDSKFTYAVNEIFTSVSGEVGQFRQGSLTTFVRLAGCNLRCPHCDTKYSLTSTGSEMLSARQIINRINKASPVQIHQVLLTGGEPLYRRGAAELIDALAEGYYVQVETNGTIFPESTNACYVLDCKVQAGLFERMLPADRMANLPDESWIKFLVGSREQLELAIHRCRQEKLHRRFLLGYLHAAFSLILPASPTFGYADMIEMLQAAGLSYAVINRQIHKDMGLVEGIHQK